MAHDSHEHTQGQDPGFYDNSLQYSCLENYMDRGTWWATVHGVTKSWSQLRTDTIIR